MKKLLFLALVIPACVVGEGGQTPPAGDDDQPPPPPDDTTTHIAADTTWSGAMALTEHTVIDSGVTVTVMPGTIITLTSVQPNTLDIQGTLIAHGLKGQEIELKPEGLPYLNIQVHGTLDYSYVLQHGGGFTTNAGSTATVVDSKLFGAPGDLVIMNGGTLSLTYSQLGADVGTADITHCNMHFGGAGNAITVMHNNIEGSPFGLMLYGGQAANFTLNNWEANATADAAWVDSAPTVSGDFTGSFFSNGDPVAKAGATFTLASSTTRLTDAGIR